VYSNLLFSPCYSNLLLRRRGWTGILRWGVLGYVLPRLSFLWCYGVFRCSILLRIITVFRDTIYVIIIILYSWHLVICEPFWMYVWNNWSWVMHTLNTWFWCKNRVWHVLFFIMVVPASDPKDLFVECVTMFTAQSRADMGMLSWVACCFSSFADIRGRRTGCDFLDLGDWVSLSPSLGTRGGICRM
jgi:hypothetical protein